MQNLGLVGVVLYCALVFSITAANAQPTYHVSPDNPLGGGTAGVCLLMSDHGTVLDVKLTMSSGDKILDQSVLENAKQLHWDADKAPKKGWLGINITVGVPNDPNIPLPDCAALGGPDA